MEPVTRSIIGVFPGRAIKGRIPIIVKKPVLYWIVCNFNCCFLMGLFVYIYMYCKDITRCTEIYKAPVCVS